MTLGKECEYQGVDLIIDAHKLISHQNPSNLMSVFSQYITYVPLKHLQHPLLHIETVLQWHLPNHFVFH